MRNTLRKFTFFIVPLVLVTGFFVAGISAGMSCNTYPFVGENWFVSRKHLLADIPLWQNFTENKLIAQVNHRTIASLMTVLATFQISNYMFKVGSTLTRPAKMASIFLVLALWMQLSVGVKTIWESAPIHLCSFHQIGAMTVLTAFTIAMHTCRPIDARHFKNLLGKLRTENPKAFENMMTSFNKNAQHKNRYYPQYNKTFKDEKRL